MYQHKDIYTLDFTSIKHYFDVHFVIREAFDWPEFYGCNWDAFWDFITDMIGEYVHIEIIGLNILKQKFDDTADMLIETLRDFKHIYNDEYADKILIEIVDKEHRTLIE